MGEVARGFGFEVTRRQGCDDVEVPCAHLVADCPQSAADFHWVYRDADGDVHDPSPVSMAMWANHPDMRSLALTIQSNRRSTPDGFYRLQRREPGVSFDASFAESQLPTRNPT
jgi:hypothetical protein